MFILSSTVLQMSIWHRMIVLMTPNSNITSQTWQTWNCNCKHPVFLICSLNVFNVMLAFENMRTRARLLNTRGETSHEAVGWWCVSTCYVVEHLATGSCYCASHSRPCSWPMFLKCKKTSFQPWQRIFVDKIVDKAKRFTPVCHSEHMLCSRRLCRNVLNVYDMIQYKIQPFPPFSGKPVAPLCSCLLSLSSVSIALIQLCSIAVQCSSLFCSVGQAMR